MGIAFFLLGKVFTLISIYGITGLAISESIPKPTGSALGIGLIILGILIFIAGLEMED